jgi:hypothetical protein
MWLYQDVTEFYKAYKEHRGTIVRGEPLPEIYSRNLSFVEASFRIVYHLQTVELVQLTIQRKAAQSG